MLSDDEVGDISVSNCFVLMSFGTSTLRWVLQNWFRKFYCMLYQLGIKVFINREVNTNNCSQTTSWGIPDLLIMGRHLEKSIYSDFEFWTFQSRASWKLVDKWLYDYEDYDFLTTEVSFTSLSLCLPVCPPYLQHMRWLWDWELAL